MPNEDDIFLMQTENNLSASFNYDTTGADIEWDFSDLDLTNQRLDTFVSVLATPPVYNLVFNNPLDPARRATIATPQDMPVSPPGIAISEVFMFLKESAQEFSEVGFGAKINGFPTPIKYDNPDVLYRFPVTYGSQDSSFSSFAINVPSYGYYGQDKKRFNTVDGWGTLLTPDKQYPVMRIKSDVFYEDTLYYDQMGFGTAISRHEVEYKWLSLNIGVPVLQITERMGGTVSIELFDSSFVNTAGIENINSNTKLHLYPNPAHDILHISFPLKESTHVSIAVYDISGRIVFREDMGLLPQGFVYDRLHLESMGLKPGVYTFSIETERKRVNRMLVIL